MKINNTRRGFAQEEKDVVICPPCGEQSLAPEGFNPGAALAAKEGQNRKITLYSLLPRLTAVLPPQGRAISRGFTLIELLVVVLIIGILAAVAVPQYQKAVNKARGTEVLNAIDAIDKQVVALYLEDSNYARVPFIGIEAPELHYFGYKEFAGNNGTTPQYKAGPHLQIGTSSSGWKTDSPTGSIKLTFFDPALLLQITTNCDKKTNLRIICNEKHGKISPVCEDFFDCTRTSPRALQVLCGKEQWTGEGCYIK